MSSLPAGRHGCWSPLFPEAPTLVSLVLLYAINCSIIFSKIPLAFKKTELRQELKPS